MCSDFEQNGDVKPGEKCPWRMSTKALLWLACFNWANAGTTRGTSAGLWGTYVSTLFAFQKEKKKPSAVCPIKCAKNKHFFLQSMKEIFFCFCLWDPYLDLV